MTKFIKYDFSIPPLDKETYARLKQVMERNKITRYNIVVIALNLLFDILERKPDCLNAYDAIQRVATEKGIKNA